MWTNFDLKKRGMAAFKANYWKAVLVGVVMMLVTGGFRVNYKTYGSSDDSNIFNNKTEYSYDSGYDDTYDKEGLESIEDALGEAFSDSSIENDILSDSDDIYAFLGIGMVIFMIIFLIVFIFSMCLKAFLFNPLETGARTFFRKNLDEPASAGNLGFAFDANYMNIVKVNFFRDLYIALWSLLLIIPGIIKKYEYALVPYILSENPDISKDEALAESKELMYGNKWNLFVLQLSFLGWHILSLFTLGLLEIFFTIPYQASTEAAFYEAVRYGITGNETDSYTDEVADATYYTGE
ncbi:MAG: DUF975 family protein [Lachnospiraceae bacterium]|nr:DUF975 family protein [Lachnospiraceae bacterium]